MKIDKIISKNRDERKLTNYQIAKNGDIAVQSVDNITKGIHQNPRIETLWKISKGLGIPITDLLKEYEP